MRSYPIADDPWLKRPDRDILRQDNLRGVSARMMLICPVSIPVWSVDLASLGHPSLIWRLGRYGHDASLGLAEQ